MLKIKPCTRFKKDLKKFQHNQSVIKELDVVLNTLSQEAELAEKYQDHPLSGGWNNSRDCHSRFI